MISRPTRIPIAWFVFFQMLSLQVSALDGISLCFLRDCYPVEESKPSLCGCSDPCATDDTSQQSPVEVLRKGHAENQCECRFEFSDWMQDVVVSVQTKAVDKAQPDCDPTPTPHSLDNFDSFRTPLCSRPIAFPPPDKALVSLQTVVLRH